MSWSNHEKRLTTLAKTLALITALAAFIAGMWLLLGLILSWALAPLFYLLALITYTIP